MTGSVNLFLRGYCHSCNGKKSLPYTQNQLKIEGERDLKVFKECLGERFEAFG